MSRKTVSLVCAVFAGLISLTSTAAFANAEHDRRSALETVGFLRSWDNVDGLFADYVASSYRDYFASQTRFTLKDLSKADELLSKAKLPYRTLIHDAEVLGQIARSSRSESIIRTEIQKDGRQYRFTLEWLLSPQMDLLASDTFVLEDQSRPGGGGQGPGLESVHAALGQALDRLLRQVPFLGHVTGRDHDSVTVNLGRAQLHRGDVLLVSTVDEMKRHPLLKAIVDWRMLPVGRLEVEEVDERIAFCKVLEERDNLKIARLQKITQIIPGATLTPAPKEAGAEPAKEDEERPRLGWVAASLGLGSFGRQYTAGDGAQVLLSGSGLSLNPRAEAQIWLNRDWFTDLALSYGLWSYSQKNQGAGAAVSAESVSVTESGVRIGAGYSYLLNGTFLGPKGWVKAGYRSSSTSFPTVSTEFTAPISFKSLVLGVGGELPVRSGWNALVNIDFGIFPSATETGGLAGTANSASSVAIYLGGSYQYAPRIGFRAGLEIVSHSAQFSSGASISQRNIVVGPSVLYYF